MPQNSPPNDAGQIAGQVKANGEHQSARKIARKSAANATAERAPTDEPKIWGNQGVNGVHNLDIKSSPLAMPIRPPNVVPWIRAQPGGHHGLKTRGDPGS